LGILSQFSSVLKNFSKASEYAPDSTGVDMKISTLFLAIANSFSLQISMNSGSLFHSISASLIPSHSVNLIIEELLRISITSTRFSDHSPLALKISENASLLSRSS
jgi:hypothetical protein